MLSKYLLVWMNEQDYAKELHHHLHMGMMLVVWGIKKPNVYEMLKKKLCLYC